MGKLHRLYAITSVCFLVALLVSPLKSYFSEWRDIQNEFNRQIQKMPQKIKPAPLALQQIWVRDLERIDRCVTCHVGVNDSKLIDMPLPYKTHSKIPHDIDKFGCTICHGGQGLATDYVDAHFQTEIWHEPVLPKHYTEALCGRCHIGDKLESTPTLNRGRELIEDLNCRSCHELRGYAKRLNLSLDGIGAKVVERSWLVRWLQNPHTILPNSKMPRFLLKAEEVEVLADFLMSFKTFPNNARLDSLPDIYWQKKDDDDFINLGKTRFREARCISCHEVDERGGHLAPDLAKIASKAKAAWIFNFIKNPRLLQPEIEMPQYGFSDEEIAAITSYMKAEFIDWDAAEDEATEQEPIANFYERGLAIFNQYNCGGCHQISSAKIAENLGPDLLKIGNKKIYELDFGNSNIPHTIYDYIDAKIKSPDTFGENVRMPIYLLTEADRIAITTAILAQRSEQLPLNYIRFGKSPSKYKPQGKLGQIIEKYSCLKCHPINGVGGNIAPDLSIVGSQLQRDWTKQYFRVPYSLRAIVEERMPNLFISENEVETWLDYSYSVLLDDSISMLNNWETLPINQETGKMLIQEKYGCQSCHILGGKGGYVGPPLDDVGDRLQPGWMFSWLMNPQKYIPETIEPRSGMSEEEAWNIVAYLMSLKKEK